MLSFSPRKALKIILLSLLLLFLAVNGGSTFEHSEHLTPSSKLSNDGFAFSENAEVADTCESTATDKESCEICEIKLQSVLDILTTEDKEELLEKTHHKSFQKKENSVEGHEESGSVWSFFGFEESPESEDEKDVPKDSDFDGIPDDKDDDDDNDGIPDYLDEDDDGDGILDIFEADYSADGAGEDIFYDFQVNEIVYEQKEEPGRETPSVGEENRDHLKDGIEVEVLETTEETPLNEELQSTERISATETATDSDGDGVPDDLDDDDDNDGVPDDLDEDDDGNGVLDLLEKEFAGDLSTVNLAEAPEAVEADDLSESEESSEDDLTSEDGRESDEQIETEGLKDSDNDGIPDIYDEDDDNDGIPDYLDDDDDGDGILDFLEEEFTGELPTFATEETNEIVFDEDDEVEAEESIQESVKQTPSEDEKAAEETFEVDRETSETGNIVEQLTPNSLKDSDNDGIPDIEDDDDDNDGIPDYLDDDDDGDGILDFLEDDYQPDTTYDEKSFDEIVNDETAPTESLESEFLKDSDNDGVPDIYDDDDDNDGIPDHLDDDDDGDGILDFLEEEFNENLATGLAVEGLKDSFQEVNKDIDTDESAEDSGVARSEAEAGILGQSSADEVEVDAVENVKDKPTESDLKDSDNDGIPDDEDDDDDNDGIPDYLDDDDDGDGILDFLEDDYQPDTTYDENSFQEILVDEKIAAENLDSENLKDSDNDGVPDVYDDDDDNDGIPDYLDDDDDGDGILDFLEDDQNDESESRTDGRYYSESHDKETDSHESEQEQEEQKEVESNESNDEVEENQEIPEVVFKDGESIGEAPAKDPPLERDSDFDGVPDYLDDDDDNDGIPDYLDDDDDGDGILDILERQETDAENIFFDFQEYQQNEDDVSADEGKNEDAAEPIVEEDGQSDLHEEQPDVVEQDVESEVYGLKDSDNDGVPDIYDEDDDNDGIPDYLDDDDDGDGILDFLEEEFTGELPTFATEETNEIVFDEDDEVEAEESIQESVEQTPSEDKKDAGENFEVDSETENIVEQLTPNSLKDSDNDGIPDIEDDDDDNDGIPDYLDDDDDGDGILDFLEEEFTNDQAAFATTKDLAESAEEITDAVEPEEAEEYLSPEYVESETEILTVQSYSDEVGPDDGADDDDDGDIKSTSEEPIQEILKDSDNDGIPDIYDEDDDNDGIPDYLDDDDDGDGILDFLEEEFMDDSSKVLSAEESFKTPEGMKIQEVVDDEEEFLKDFKNVEDQVDEDEKDESTTEALEQDSVKSDLRKTIGASSVVIGIQKHGESQTAADDDKKKVEASESDDLKDSEDVAQEIPENLAQLSDKDSDLDGIPDYVDDDDDNDGIPDYLDDDDDGDGILDFLDDDYHPYAFDEGKETETELLDEGKGNDKSVDEESRKEDVAAVEPTPNEDVEVDDDKEKIESVDDGLKDSDKLKDSDLDGIPDYIDDDDDNDGIPDYLDDDDDGDGILDFLEDDYAGYSEAEVPKEAEEETEIEVDKQIASALGTASESSEESSFGNQPTDDRSEKEEHDEEPQIKEVEEEKDSDGDGVPDSIDDDDDNDGVPDDMDDDDDGNGVPDFLEADYVEESVADFEYIENKSADTLVEESDYSSDKLKKELIDSDLDGIPDYLDDDDDNDGIPDYLDEDDDGDGILDFLEDDYVEESANLDDIESVATLEDQGEFHEETSTEEVGSSETVDQPVEEKEEADEQSESITSEEDAFSFSKITDYFFQSEPPNETVDESTKDGKPKKPKRSKQVNEHKTIKEFYSVPPSQAFTPEERERFQSLVNPPVGINIDLITDSDGDGVPDYRDEDDDDDGIPDHYDPEFKLPLIIQEQLSQSDETPNITVEENKVLLSELIQLLSNSPEEDLDPAVKGIDSEQTCQLSGILKNIEKSVPKSFCDSSVEHLESRKTTEKETKVKTEHGQRHPDEELEENLDLWTAVKLFIWGNEAEKEKTI